MEGEIIKKAQKVVKNFKEWDKGFKEYQHKLLNQEFEDRDELKKKSTRERIQWEEVTKSIRELEKELNKDKSSQTKKSFKKGG